MTDMKVKRTKDYSLVVDWWVPRVQGEFEIVGRVAEATGLSAETVSRLMLGVRLDYLLMSTTPEQDDWEKPPE